MATFMKSFPPPATTYFIHPVKATAKKGWGERGRNTFKNSVLVVFIKVRCSI